VADNGEGMTRDEAIAEITRRLVDYYRPERVYLFGSVARGDDGADSDLDFCAVLPDNAWPATDFDARAEHVAASLPATIVREGRLLYDARRVAA
jgi:predicted nucleotidyltransferase